VVPAKVMTAFLVIEKSNAKIFAVFESINTSLCSNIMFSLVFRDILPEISEIPVKES
jgi:hypothetical protein